MTQSSTPSLPGPVQAPRSQRLSRRFPRAVAGFLLPNFVGFLTFTLLPVVFSFCIIFTNYNLRSTPTEFLGLRNFTDLLGVRPVSAASPAIAWSYAAGAALLLAGMLLTLWANVSAWPGRRLGGGALAVLGASLVLTWCVAAVVPSAALLGHSLSAAQGVLLGGMLAGILGLVMSLRNDQDWRFGAGTLPAVLTVAGVVILWLLHDPMWRACEPRDPRFWKYLYNTLYLMLGIPVSIAGSLALALLLNNSFRIARSTRITGSALCLVCGVVTFALLQAAGTSSSAPLFRDLAALGGVLWLLAALGVAFDVVAFRTIFYLPAFTSGVALMLLWKSLFNPKSGMINTLLAQAANAGIAIVNCITSAWHAIAAPGAEWHPVAALTAAGMPLWLGSTDWAKPALIIMGVWTVVGGTNMLLYLAGLSNIPGELLDAAKVDGAGPWQRFRHITWPQLAPTTFFICIMSIIGGMQGGFEQARVMTEGGPDGATTTLNYYIYNVFYQDLELGYGATIAWVLFALIFVATAVNWKYGKNIEVGS